MAFSSPIATNAQAAAQTYTVVDLGELHSLRNGGVYGINDAGQIVGGNGHAFLWENGKFKDLGTLTPEGLEDSTTSIASSINRKGQIVGSSGSFGPVVMSGLQCARGIFYGNGRLRQFTQKNTSFEPYVINDRGQIAGLDAYRGFFYSNGKLTDLGTLSHVTVGNRSTARALNNHGQVVGWSTAPGLDPAALPVHAFVWQKTGEIRRMHDLGTLPGCRNSEAFGINCTGTIVGQSDSKAFIWQRATMRDLNELLPVDSPWVLNEARAINSKGQIVGMGTLGDQAHMFLLTPR